MYFGIILLLQNFATFDMILLNYIVMTQFIFSIT